MRAYPAGLVCYIRLQTIGSALTIFSSRSSLHWADTASRREPTAQLFQNVSKWENVDGKQRAPVPTPLHFQAFQTRLSRYVDKEGLAWTQDLEQFGDVICLIKIRIIRGALIGARKHRVVWDRHEGIQGVLG